jgi:hypothetical protein
MKEWESESSKCANLFLGVIMFSCFHLLTTTGTFDYIWLVVRISFESAIFSTY